MRVEQVLLDQLVLDPSNARKHAPKNLEAIKGSLAKFGQQKPIVVGRNGIVIAGNGTLEAARALGWIELAVVRTELTGVEATAFALADNRAAELADWDRDILYETLKSLDMSSFDIGTIGFDLSEWEPPSFDPAGEGDQGKLDEKTPIECPECGHAFTP